MNTIIESVLKRLFPALLCVFSLAAGHSAYAQVPGPTPYSGIETKPSFMGAENNSLNEFRSWIEDRLQLNDKLESSRIFFSVIVGEDGRVSGFEVIRDDTGDSALRADLERVVAMSPRWAPGLQREIPQSVSVTLYVDFMRPDLLAEKRNRAAGEKRRQEEQKDIEASASEKRFIENLVAMGADPETAVIEDISGLGPVISAATKPVVVIYFKNPLHRPCANLIKQWNGVLADYAGKYDLRAVYSRLSFSSGFEDYPASAQFAEEFGLTAYPVTVFFYDRMGDYECFTGFDPEKIPAWFGGMMEKADF